VVVESHEVPDGCLEVLDGLAGHLIHV
jgi:hypothetical protein